MKGGSAIHQVSIQCNLNLIHIIKVGYSKELQGLHKNSSFENDPNN